MRETLSDAPGVGLAAPQIGEPLQLAIIEDKAEYQANLTEVELAERGRRPVPFHVLINPEIRLLSSPDIAFFEGCLSLPGFLGMVPRARKVSVKALNQFGEPVYIEAEGWYARILQHEIDHLKGTLYIDHMWSRSFCSLDNYNKHWKSKPPYDSFRNSVHCEIMSLTDDMLQPAGFQSCVPWHLSDKRASRTVASPLVWNADFSSK